MIKSRRMSWAGHVARMGRVEYAGSWQENMRKRDNLEEPGVDGRIVLSCIIKKWGGLQELNKSGSG
jgi:hypothetical protein